MINKDEIKDKLLNKYVDKNLTIVLNGNIETSFIIYNSKILMNDYRIILTDSMKKEIIIKLDELVDVQFDNCLILDLGNQTVIIDT